MLLFLTLIGVLLFFLFRPAKTEDDIEYFHQEVKSPPVDFDNFEEELIGRVAPMYISSYRPYYAEPRRIPMFHKQRRISQSTARTERKPSVTASRVITSVIASTTTVGQPVITLEPTEPSYGNTSHSPGISSAEETMPVTETAVLTESETTTYITSSVQDNIEEVQKEITTNRPLVLMSEDVENDCSEHLASGKASGIYLISPGGAVPFPVFCDQETSGGGWTVIQRRVSSKVFFHNRTWDEYANGFGDLDGSYWLGLEKVHHLAPLTGDSWILRIELNGDHCVGQGCIGQSDGYWWAEWPFKLGHATQLYLLELGSVIRGNLTDENSDFFQRNNGHPFTTVDRDNDDAGSNCALTRNHGGWWHEKCGNVALNGLYGDTTALHRNMMFVYQNMTSGHKRRVIHPKRSIMMIRPGSSF